MSKPEVVAHQCSMSLRCKSDTCTHAKPHTPSDCDCPACCGQWPGNADFKPRVACIPVDQVRAPEDGGNRKKPEAELSDHEKLQAETERLQAERAADKARIAALEATLRTISEEVDGNIRECVRDCVNQLGNVQDIYDYCDRIDATIDAALAQQGKEGECSAK